MTDMLRVLLAVTDEGEAGVVERVLRMRWPDLVHRVVHTPEDLHEAIREQSWDLLVVGTNAPAMAIEAVKDAGWDRLLIAIDPTPESREAADLLHIGVRAVIPRDGIGDMVPIIAREMGVRRDRQLRRQSDKLLARSEARYRRLFEASLDGIVVVDAASGRVTEVNRALQDFLGHRAHNLVGKVMWDNPVLAPLAGGIDGRKILESSGRLQRDCVPLPTASGHVLWADIIACVQDIEGEAVIQFNVRDITERKRSEDGLARANRALRTLSRANETLVHARSEAQLVEGACRILVKVGGFRLAWVAYPPDPVAEGAGWRVVAHHGHRDPDAREAGPIWPVTRDSLDRARAGGGDQPAPVVVAGRAALVLPLRHVDAVLGVVTIVADDVAAFDDRTRQVLDELAGDLAYGIQAQRDRARYERAEEALRSSETRFRTLAETASDALIVSDQDGRVIFWNQAAQRIFGYAEAEVLGTALHDLVASPQDAEAHRHAMAAFRQGGHGPAVGRRLELMARRKDGTAFPVELTLSSTRVNGCWHALGIVRDVSERRQMEERLHQADKMDALGNMAGGIAHDLKNMLFPVLSLIGLTIKELPPDSRQRARLEKVLQAAQRARALVERIHAFSHRAPVARVEVDISQLVAEALGLVRPMLPATIQVVEQWRFSPDTRVLIDASQFDAIVLNFASNAVDAMEGRPGTLTITGGETEMHDGSVLPEPGAYVWLAFGDSGGGIRPEIQDQIFEPWFSTKGRGKGAGLGLAMVKKILSEIGGAVTVDSALGQGATFTIYLPRLVVGEGGPAALSSSQD